MALEWHEDARIYIFGWIIPLTFKMTHFKVIYERFE